MTTSQTARSRPPARPGADDVEPDHRWLVRVWLIVASFAVVTLVKSSQIGIPLRDPHSSILVSRLGISFTLFGMLAVLDARLRAGRWRGVVGVLTTRWPRRRVVVALQALLAYHLTYFCYHNLKNWDAFNRPRDAMLLHWDRILFLGHSPAVLLHHLLGQHVAAYVLMLVYESFSTLLAVAVVASLVFVDRLRDGYVFIASGIWIWILGVGSYYLIPSLGPFHSAPQEFAGLPHTMIQDTQATYLAQRTYLLAHPHAGDAFAQISAFASLHVALTALIFLMARYYRLRRTAWVLLAWLIATMVATIYLGWHFAVDDVAGLLIAFLGVFLGRLTVHPRIRSARVPVRESGPGQQTGHIMAEPLPRRTAR